MKKKNFKKLSTKKSYIQTPQLNAQALTKEEQQKIKGGRICGVTNRFAKCREMAP